MRSFVSRFEKYKHLIEEYYDLFSIKNVQQFELNQRGQPYKKMVIPNHLFFVELKSNKKIPVSLEGLLAKNEYIASKQYYLMQIMQVEKDIQRAKHIYTNWDWLEFIIYHQSLLSVRILEN